MAVQLTCHKKTQALAIQAAVMQALWGPKAGDKYALRGQTQSVQRKMRELLLGPEILPGLLLEKYLVFGNAGHAARKDMHHREWKHED